jgi:predicted DNA-binding transcriptional regulator YafY
MNRTDRLYAMVEELRAVAPRPRSARWLAGHFEVSPRTIERDIGALQESGVPIYAEPGRTGGYALDRTHTLPPVNVSPSEAVAIAVALRRLDGAPFADAARSALHKLLAVMPPEDVARAGELARRVHLLHPPDVPAAPPVPRAVADALSAGRVLLIEYRDRHGEASSRRVEPVGYVGGPSHWYLLGWCRLRGGLRAFRLDRIASVHDTGEVAPPRRVDTEDLDIPAEWVTQLTMEPVETPTGRCRPAVRVLTRRQPSGPAPREETKNVRDDQWHRLVRDRHG